MFSVITAEPKQSLFSVQKSATLAIPVTWWDGSRHKQSATSVCGMQPQGHQCHKWWYGSKPLRLNPNIFPPVNQRTVSHTVPNWTHAMFFWWLRRKDEHCWLILFSPCMTSHYFDTHKIIYTKFMALPLVGLNVPPNITDSVDAQINNT